MQVRERAKWGQIGEFVEMRRVPRGTVLRHDSSGLLAALLSNQQRTGRCTDRRSSDTAQEKTAPAMS